QQYFAVARPQPGHEGFHETAPDAPPVRLRRDGHPRDLRALREFARERQESDDAPVFLGNKPLLRIEIPSRLGDPFLDPEPVRQRPYDPLAGIRILSPQFAN